MTHVDECERLPDESRLHNVEGARRMAEAAAACGARLVFVSTDYVFDGQARGATHPNP